MCGLMSWKYTACPERAIHCGLPCMPICCGEATCIVPWAVPSVRQSAEIQRSKLAGAQISDLQVKHAFDEAFVSGYHEVIWISVGLALLSALSAQMIQPKKHSSSVGNQINKPQRTFHHLLFGTSNENLR